MQNNATRYFNSIATCVSKEKKKRDASIPVLENEEHAFLRFDMVLYETRLASSTQGLVKSHERTTKEPDVDLQREGLEVVEVLTHMITVSFSSDTVTTVSIRGVIAPGFGDNSYSE